MFPYTMLLDRPLRNLSLPKETENRPGPGILGDDEEDRS